jgi:hypothetical protein
LPRLGLLGPLSKGQIESSMAEAIKMTDRLEAELPHMVLGVYADFLYVSPAVAIMVIGIAIARSFWIDVSKAARAGRQTRRTKRYSRSSAPTRASSSRLIGRAEWDSRAEKHNEISQA